MARARTAGRAVGTRFALGPLLAALAVMALLASACSGSTTAAAADGGGSADEDGPGVDGDTVKIGFIDLDTATVAKALKLDFPEQGDQPAQVAALVEWINANGGIGGRQVEAVIRPFNALLDSADSEEKLCNEFTQDDEVFAVVLQGMFQENLRPCFEQAETVMIENTLYPLPAVTMEDLAPYYMNPNYPTYDDVIAGFTGVFEETGFLDGGTVGVIGVDTEANRDIYEEQLAPVLEAAGSGAAEVRWIDLADSANTRAGYEQAVIAYKAAGVDRLITLGGSRLLSYFLDYTTKQDFLPKLLLTSYDNTDFNVATYPEAMEGAVGLSASPSWDFLEPQLPSPANEAEAECRDMYAEAGVQLGDRSESRTANFTCDAIRFLQAAAEQAEIDADTPLNAARLYEGVLALDDEWQAGQNYETRFDGLAAGAAGYQVFVIDPATGSTAVIGEPKEF